MDNAIIFAPSGHVIDVAVRSERKGGIVVVGVFRNISNFFFYEQKIIK